MPIQTSILPLTGQIGEADCRSILALQVGPAGDASDWDTALKIEMDWGDDRESPLSNSIRRSRNE